MHHSIRGIRWIVGFALVFALSAMALPRDASAQARASITIYKSQCPVGYEGDNFFEDCYPNAMEGITFTLTPEGGTAATAVTGASGFTAFEDLGGGTYVLAEEIPGDFNDFVAFCSAGGETFPFEYATNANGIVLELTTADDLRCDFYNIPADQGQPDPDEAASVSIYKTTCPAGYEGDDFFEDCYDNPTAGVSFFLSELGSDVGVTAETGDEGFAAFEDLDAGTYLLGEDLPDDVNDFVAFCSAGGETFPFEYATDVSGIVLELTTADDLRCDFYNIPAEVAAQTPVPTVTPARTPTTTTTVAQLPSTGAGTSTGDGIGMVAFAAILAVFGVAAVGFGARTRAAKRS